VAEMKVELVDWYGNKAYVSIDNDDMVVVLEVSFKDLIEMLEVLKVALKKLTEETSVSA
jgi:hypothetical protein